MSPSRARLMDSDELSCAHDEFRSLPGVVELLGEQRDVLVDVARPHLVSGGDPLRAYFTHHHRPERTDLLDVHLIDRRAQILENRQDTIRTRHVRCFFLAVRTRTPGRRCQCGNADKRSHARWCDRLFAPGRGVNRRAPMMWLSWRDYRSAPGTPPGSRSILERSRGPTTSPSP